MKRPSRFLAILAAVCTSLGTAHAVDPILNEHGVPAVWASIYGITGPLTMSADPDGDGLLNSEEATAGTNPFSPNDVLQVKEITAEEGVIYLTFPTVAGKNYQPQSTPSLSSPSWSNVGGSYAGNDGNVTADITDPMTTPKYYRILVSSIDSDGDGVSDWEEGKLGLDPFSPSSNGSTSDMAVATAAMASSSVVTIIAADNLSSEPVGTNPATDLATFTISRTGGLRPITVSFTVSGPAVGGTDYEAIGATSVTLGLGVPSAKIVITPKSDLEREGAEAVILTLNAGSGFTLGTPSVAAVLIQDYNDNTSPGGTGVMVQFRNEASSGAASPAAAMDPSLLFQGSVAATLSNVQFRGEWGTGNPAAGVNVNDFTSRWSGEVMPEFSQTYTFYLTANDASRLWVDGQLLIDNFPKHPTYTPAITTATLQATIALVAGKRYPIRVDHFDDQASASVVLQWTCAALSNVIQDIPVARLFNQVPPQFAGDTSRLALVSTDPYEIKLGDAFGGNPTSYSATNLPTGWSVNTGTGVISGVPSAALVGEYDIPVSATNTHGTGSAIVRLTILNTGSALTKEVWTTGAPFASLAAVPFHAAPNSSASVATNLSTTPSSQVNAMRLRGFITAPVTGSYKFFLGGDDEAEFWLSNSDQYNDLWKRSTLSSGTTAGSWTGAAVSDLLHLIAGRRYYFEVRSRNSGAPDGFVELGWIKPGESVTVPNQIVPKVNLSPWVEPPPVDTSGTLYVTAMTAQGNAQTNGSGGATFQLSADETYATVRFTYANMTGPLTQHHLHSDAWNGKAAGVIIFDMDELPAGSFKNPDGSYHWQIQNDTGFTAAEKVQALKDGAVYINIHTALYAAGEIRGNFTLATGSQTFEAPAAPPSAPASATTDADAARFLIQATFGPNTTEIAAVRATTYEAWIDNEFTKAPTYHLFPFVWENRNQTNFGNGAFSGAQSQNAWWKHSITAPDQLRQKMAHALAQILVVSRENELDVRNDTVADYYDMLLDNSFGNFRTLLEDVSLHPAMGAYLDMLNNDKPDITTGRIPNENYAREILQLFSLGLYRMWPDGSLMLDSTNTPIPTYDQEAIIGFSHAFTGWTFDQANNGAFLPNQVALGAAAADTVLPITNPTGAPFNTRAWVSPMKQVPNHHFTGPKRVLNNVVLPGLTQITNGGVPQAPPDPYVYIHTTQQIQTPEYQALSALELDQTHDQIFNHPNVGPFLCRQLIQRFVTSTPSRGYLYRVVQAFNNNGSGVRGDLKAVLKAILLDYEARSPVEAARPGFGKQREPILRVSAVARAFAPPPNGFGGTYTQDGGVILVNCTPQHSLLANTPVQIFFTPGTGVQATDARYTLFNFSAAQGAQSASIGSPGTGNTSPALFSIFPTRTMDLHRGSFTHSTANGGTLTITTANGHNLAPGRKAYLRFRTGGNNSTAPTGGTTLDGLYTCATGTTGSTVVVTGIANPTTVSATSVDVHMVRGGYRKDSASVARVESYTRHGLSVGQTVYAAFILGTGAVPLVDGTYTVATVPDDNTFTLNMPGDPGTVGGQGTVVIGVQFANATAARAVLNRTGNATVAYSTWGVGITDNDLGQTPLYAQSVFNFYLPDYQFPGNLAKAGLITPEFQLTSETQVVRANNFMFNGIFRGTTQFGSNDWSQAGIGGFQSYSGGITLDVGKWMGVRAVVDGGTGGATDYWTNGTNTANPGNLGALFDKLNAIMTGGVLPSSGSNVYGSGFNDPTRSIKNMKQACLDYIFGTSAVAFGTGNITYTNAAPTAIQRRDRARAMIHFIATSADFTIQK